MSRIIKRKICWLLLCTMGVTNIVPVMAKPIVTIKMNVENEDNLSSIAVKELPPIDLYLTVGDSELNVSNFKNDVIEEFKNRGVDTSNINVTAIETSNVNISNAFTWEQNVHSSIGSIAIQNSGTSLSMRGNTRLAGKNAIWTYPTIQGHQEFSVDYNINYGDSFNGAGVLLKVEQVGNTLKGYMLSFNNRGAFAKSNGTGSIWKFTYPLNENTKAFTTSQLTRVSSLNIKNSGTLNFLTTNREIKITGGGLTSPVVIEIDNNWSNGNGFGFFSDHYSHNCSNIGNFTLNNIGLSITESKTFSELIREPKWEDKSKRFVVNLNDKLDKDFENSSTLSEILTKTLNEDIHYMGWGNDINKKQNERFIKNNNNQGIILDNKDYENSIVKIVDYVVSQLDLNTSTSNNILVGSNVDIQVYPQELKDSSANVTNPYGRWKTIHDYEYFENNEGQAPFSGMYQDALEVSFDKPGKYDITFDGELVKTIVVHRAPIANYQTILNDLELEIIEDSFDVDKISSSNQGIINKEWKWKETTEDDWFIGLPPSTLEEDKDYVIQLRVQDEQGTWSSPTTKYVSTKNIQSTPIAEFNIKNTSFTKYQQLEIIDTSYDPTGKEINGLEWTLRKNNIQVYKGSTLPTDYNTYEYGEGDYSLSLRVKNSFGTWSESFTRYFTITKDITAPELKIDKITQSWINNNIDVNIQVSDKGGSNLDGSRIAISNTNQKIEDETLWSKWLDDSEFIVSLVDEGTHFIHIESKDNEGNVTNRVVGPYQIDKSAPIVSHTLNVKEQTNGNVVIYINANDDLSGIETITLPDGTSSKKHNTSYEVNENGSYTFVITDKVGNEEIYTVDISNIDKTLPNISHSLSTSSWTNNYVDIHLVGDKDYGRIILPDGTYVMGTETIYRVYENGDYTFNLSDFAGNEVVYTVSINNFDVIKPSGTFSINNETNGNTYNRKVTLNLDFIDDGVGIDYIDITEVYEKTIITTSNNVTTSSAITIPNTTVITQNRRIDINSPSYENNLSWTLTDGLGIKQFTINVVDKLGNNYIVENEITLIEQPTSPGEGDNPVIMPTPDGDNNNKPTDPEDKPTEPEDKPTEPEDRPTEPEDKPTDQEDKPNKPNNNNNYVIDSKPAINNTGKDKDNIEEKKVEMTYVIFTKGVRNYAVDSKVIFTDVTPILKNGRVYIPIRYLSNALNISDENIKWQPSLQEVTIQDGDNILTLRIDERYITLNDEKLPIDGSAFIEKNRVYLPISQIKEVFKDRNLMVEWKEINNQVIISFEKE